MSAKKRLTKTQRDARAKAALAQRINDVVQGACGGGYGADDPLWADQLSRIIPALRWIFCDTDDSGRPRSASGLLSEFMFSPQALKYYVSIEDLVDFFWREGARA